MEKDSNKFESVYSSKVKAGKRRTYFFDVRKTKGEDFYITLTESTKKFNSNGYERHKIFLYKEDFNRFLSSLNEVVDHVKTELMPDFDYEQYERRQAEWEASLEKENAEAKSELPTEESTSTESPSTEIPLIEGESTDIDSTESDSSPDSTEDDMSW